MIPKKRERSVKAGVTALLTEFDLWKYMAPASRFGMPALDYLVCFRGRFLAIETKRPNKKPTPRQWETIKALRAAGATVFVVRDNDSLRYLEKWLRCMRACLPQTAQAVYGDYLTFFESNLGFDTAQAAARPRRGRRPAVSAISSPETLEWIEF